jgi:hypothetical protein
MNLLDERAQVREAAGLWRHRYKAGSKWIRTDRHADTAAVYERLAALDVDTATAADVEAIIGNRSWCEPQRCHECGVRSWHVVQLGEDPDYESATANICTDCLRAALALVTP